MTMADTPDNKERADFEAWARNEQGWDDVQLRRYTTGGGYMNQQVAHEWRVWQAARRAPAIGAVPELPAIETLSAALHKIIEMNRQHAEDQYGDANKAETWACIRVAREALKSAGAQPADRAEDKRIADALNTTLWLYRRLPSCYGNPPFVDQAIMAFADVLGLDAPASIQERVRLHKAAAPSPTQSGAQPEDAYMHAKVAEIEATAARSRERVKALQEKYGLSGAQPQEGES